MGKATPVLRRSLRNRQKDADQSKGKAKDAVKESKIVKKRNQQTTCLISYQGIEGAYDNGEQKTMYVESFTRMGKNCSHKDCDNAGFVAFRAKSTSKKFCLCPFHADSSTSGNYNKVSSEDGTTVDTLPSNHPQFVNGVKMKASHDVIKQIRQKSRSHHTRSTIESNSAIVSDGSEYDGGDGEESGDGDEKENKQAGWIEDFVGSFDQGGGDEDREGDENENESFEESASMTLQWGGGGDRKSNDEDGNTSADRNLQSDSSSNNNNDSSTASSNASSNGDGTSRANVAGHVPSSGRTDSSKLTTYSVKDADDGAGSNSGQSLHPKGTDNNGASEDTASSSQDNNSSNNNNNDPSGHPLYEAASNGAGVGAGGPTTHQKECNYPSCQPCKNSETCVICDEDYHQPCRIKFEISNPPAVNWKLCYHCQPTQRESTKRCALLNQSIREWSVSMKWVVKQSKNQGEDTLNNAKKAWDDITEPINSDTTVGSYEYTSKLGGVRVGSPATKECVIMVRDAIQGELERLLPVFYRMQSVKQLNDIFLSLEGIFTDKGEGVKDAAEEEEEEEEKKTKTKTKRPSKTKKRKLEDNKDESSVKQHDDEKQKVERPQFHFGRIICSCCAISMPAPFKDLQDSEGNAYKNTIFRSNAGITEYPIWSSNNHSFVYCSPQSKSVKLGQWGCTINCTTLKGIGMLLYSLPLKSFCMSYVNTVGDNECQSAFDDFITSIRTRIQTDDKEAKTMKFSHLQEAFFESFTNHMVQKSTSDQKVQEVWNNYSTSTYKKLFTKEAKELLEGILTDWKKICCHAVRRSIMHLRSRKLEETDLRVYEELKKSKEEEGRYFHQNSADGLVLTKDVNHNTKEIGKMLMNELFYKTRDLLTEDIKAYAGKNSLADDDFKAVVSGADSMEAEFVKKTEEIAYIIHYQWLDVITCAEKVCGLKVTD